MVSNRVPGTIFDKAEYNTGLLIWHYDRGGSQTKPATLPARYRMGLLEYDYRDGTNELALNLNRGEPTDPWSDTALGITPYTTPSTDRNTPLGTATGTRKTGWHIMNISAHRLDDDVRCRAGSRRTGQGRGGSPGTAEPTGYRGTGPATLSAKVYNLTAAPLCERKGRVLGHDGSAAR